MKMVATSDITQANQAQTLPDPDLPLVQAAKEGSIAAFDELVKRHERQMFRVAYNLLHNHEDTQDVVQEAFLRAFRFFPGFRGGDARAWLMRIVHNTCCKWLRANRPLQAAAELDEDLVPADPRAPDPEEAAVRKDRGEQLRQAVERLPPRLREVLVLRELEGMSYKEIAAIAGMPAGTVMSRLSRARDRLRRALGNLAATRAEVPARESLE